MKISFRNSYSEFLEFRLLDIIADNVKKAISRSGFTAEELSMRTNLSVATINRLKVGEHVTIKGICALAEALNEDPESFFCQKIELRESL